MAGYKTVEMFDLGDAPTHVRDAIRPVALAHVGTVDAIWKVTVGTYDRQDAVEEWALHHRMRENGPRTATRFW